MKDNGTNQQDTGSKSEPSERLGSENNLQYPEVRGQRISSEDQLRSLLDGEHSGLKKKESFPKLFDEALGHMKMVKDFEGQDRLPYGEVSSRARELKVDDETVRKWTEGVTPRLYYFMNNSLTVTEGNAKAEELLEGNNGVRNSRDVHRRLDNYYLKPEEQSLPSYKRELENMEKYYRFIDILRESGNIQDMAREAKLSESGARGHLEGSKPWLVRLAGQIPEETPKVGHKWLPLESDTDRTKNRFIQVPEKVTDYQDIKGVLDQLTPLENSKMQEYEQRFGKTDVEDAFMYLLGAYTSDAGAPNKTASAMSFGVQLSKKYDWSLDMGDAICYYLGQLGIEAHRLQDIEGGSTTFNDGEQSRIINREGKYKWASENSPLLRWVNRSCLGLDDSAKTYQQISANWILDSPEHLRSAFLQGLADGDGSVSLKGRYVCITTTQNQDFVQKLVSSFGVQTRTIGSDVVSQGHDGAKQFASISPFRYAKTRDESSQRLVKMIDSKRHIRDNPIKPFEIDFIKKLQSEGLSSWDISQKFLDSYDDLIDERTIQHIMDKMNKEHQ